MDAVLGGEAFYDAGEGGCGGPALGDIVRILEDLPSGQTLEIRSSHAAGRAGLRALCRLRGWDIQAEDTGPDGDRILVRKP